MKTTSIYDKNRNNMAGRIFVFVIALGYLYAGITFPTALLSLKILMVVSGLVMFYCLANEYKISRTEIFWNENKEFVLPFWKRILIVTIDVILVMLIISLIAASINEYAYGYTTINGVPYTPIISAIKKDSILFLIPALVLYYTCSEAIFGSTIGKTIFAAKVFHIGKDISSLKSRSDRFIVAFKRCILRFHPFNIYCLFTLKPIFYQDLFSKTICLSESEFKKHFYVETKVEQAKTENIIIKDDISKKTSITKDNKKKIISKLITSKFNNLKKLINTKNTNRDKAVKQLKELKNLLDLQLITQSEFDKKSKELKKIILDN